MISRADGRLGEPTPTGAPLDHVCPICEGEGDRHGLCYCDGPGVLTAERARELAADTDPRWAPRPLAAVPEFTGRRCGDCAFRADSLERDGKTARGLLDHLASANGEDQPFYCHQGMHHGARGYVPRQRDRHGAPVGHPLCAGWLAAYEARLAAHERSP